MSTKVCQRFLYSIPILEPLDSHSYNVFTPFWPLPLSTTHSACVKGRGPKVTVQIEKHFSMCPVKMGHH